jgi:uncharacterized protein (TIGR03086 family)
MSPDASPEVLARYEAAVDTFDGVIHQVPSGSWQSPTPCEQWNVRQLVNHVVGEQAWVTPLFAGRTVADVGTALDGDLLGDDPTAAWHHYSGEAHAALAEPDAIARTVHLSYGDETAVNYVDQLTFDALVHAWDLARASGVDDTLPDDLVLWATGWISPLLSMYRDGGAVGPPVSVADDADPQTKLLGLVGRTR